MNIELKNVWFRYGNSKQWIIKNISTTIRSGEIVYVIGKNGSGKTTFMKIAALIYRPIQGIVLANGVNFWLMNEELKCNIRKRVVYVHEKPILLNGTVMDNVIYGLTIRGISKDKAIEIASRYLQQVGIKDIAYTHTSKLSLGQAQLVSIVRALVIEPDILLLDEPLANIDNEKKEMLIDLLMDLNRKGMGIVISSHDENLGKLQINRILVIENGIIRGQV